MKLIQLDCPYDSLNTPLTQELFSKMSALKIEGYKREYPEGVLPLDTVDYIANHLLLCELTPDGWKICMGIRSISLSQCRKNLVRFPVESMVQHLPEHAVAVQKIIANAQTKNQDIAYNGSWTMSNAAQQDRNLRQLCKALGPFWLMYYHYDNQVPVVFSAGTARFKVPELQEFLGFEYLSYEGKRLPNFGCKSFFDEEVALMALHTQRVPKPALDWASKFYQLWESRMIISAPKQLQELEKKAA